MTELDDATRTAVPERERVPLRMVLTGSGSPAIRVDRAGPSQLVCVGEDEDRLLFDCGDRTSTQLLHAGIDPGAITELLFTHLHADHTHGVTQFVIGGWLRGRRTLTIYGPGNTEHFVDALFRDAYREDLETRFNVRSPMGIEDMHVEKVQAGVVIERPDYTITAAPGVHVLDPHGYRIETRDGRALVLTGDTTYCESIVELARGAHTIVHECHLGDRRHERTQPEFLRRIHSNPEQAGRTAREAGAQRLVLVHLPPEADTDRVKAQSEAVFDGEVIIGEDLMELDL